MRSEKPIYQINMLKISKLRFVKINILWDGVSCYHSHRSDCGSTR